MDFSLTRVFVLTPGQTLPTTGTTANLTPNQFGVYRPDYTPATAGNAAAAKFLFVAQGRPNTDLNLKSIKSDMIYKDKILEMYKIVAEDTARVRIINVSDWDMHCGEEVSITIRAFSNYINTTFANGLTRTITVNTPCCDCDADPCASLTADQIQAVVDEFVTKINTNSLLSRFVSASRTGTGTASVLVISGKALDKYANPCDINAFPYEYDAVNFRVFPYKNPPTTQDLLVDDPCDVFATATIVQDITYQRGSSDQVVWQEKEFYPYKIPGFKERYSIPGYNPLYVSNVVAGTFYDEYVIKFKTTDPHTWADYVLEDATVRIFIPTGQGATIETIIETGLAQTFSDVSGANISTTTTSTSTTTTSTTTTT